MKQSNRGMVLLSTLFMLLLIATLMCSMQKATWVYAKLNTRIKASHDALHAFETATQSILNLSNTHEKACTNLTPDINDARAKLTMGQGCIWREGGEHYHYWWSDLGVGDEKALRHWLLTVKHAHQFLTVRITEQKKVISWRYLVD